MIAERTNEQRADPHTGRMGSAGHEAAGAAVARVSLTRRLARQALLERYLLGRLDEGARAVLRASAIASPHVFAEVRETELDLLDALAGGTLAHDRVNQVHDWLRPYNRTAWPVSQALAEHASARQNPPQSSAVKQPSSPGVAPRVLPFPLVESVGARWRSAERAPHVLSSHLQAWPAAAIVILAAGLWFARSPSAPFVGPPGVPAAVTATASASMPAITLRLSVDASGTAAPPRLRLTPDTSHLRIEVALPSDMPSRVDVAVRTADGRLLWSMRRLVAGPSHVTVSIPAESLAKGLLSLVVAASDGSRPARRTAFFLE